MSSIPTVKIFDKERGVIIINQHEFDPATQELFEDYELRIAKEKHIQALRDAENEVATEKKAAPTKSAVKPAVPKTEE